MRRLEAIGAEVRAARLRLGFAEVKQLAEALGLDPRRVSDLELGRRALGKEDLERVSALLRLPDLGKPAHHTRRRRDRRAEAPFLRSSRVSRPYYDPAADRPTSVRRNEARRREPALLRHLELRIRAREDHHRVEALLKSMSFASYLEYLYAIWEFARGAEPLRISPHELGYSHYGLVDPVTNQAVGDRLWPALGMRRHGWVAVWFMNAPMRTPWRFWTLDGLVYSRRRSRPARWSMAEIDGDGHSTEWDSLKEEQVGLHTIRLDSKGVLDGRAWEAILRHLGRGGASRPTEPCGVAH